MKIKTTAQAGTFESSDILILVEPAGSGRKIEIDSTVLKQFDDALESDILRVLDRLDVDGIRLIAKDKGALSPTIAARVETAVLRAAGQQKGTGYENRQD